MKISFTTGREILYKSKRSRRLATPTPQQVTEMAEAEYWKYLLRTLKHESNLPYYDDEFDKWLFDNYQITMLYEDKEVPIMITGLQVDDQQALLIKLKFPYGND